MMKMNKEIQLLLLSACCLCVSSQETLSTGGVLTVVDPPPGDVARQNQELGNLKAICSSCKAVVCTLGIPNDCGAYVVCESGRQPTQLRCPFGTFYNQKENRCDFPSIIKCPNDPCSDPRYPNLVSYQDFRIKEPNCRHYWKCNGKYSAAECCPEGTAYIGRDGACVADKACNASCPRNQETQSAKGTDSYQVTICNGKAKALECPLRMEVRINEVFYGRANAKTCGPSPKIAKPCSSRSTLTTIRSQCVGKQSCTVTADPSLYSDPCPGIDKYLLINYICKPGCNLKSKDGKTFYNEANVAEIQKCSHGTRFDSELCTCVRSGSVTPLCQLEVLITFNDKENKDVQNEANSPVWINAKSIEKFNGYGTFRGKSSVTIPFYSGNDNLSRKFGIQIRIFVMAQGPSKQILLTNCNNDTSKYPNASSLEVYINRTTSSSSIHMRIINNDNTITALALPIKIKEWTNVLFRFDGSYLHGTLQHINKGTTKVQEDKASVAFSGNMMTNSGPLKIGSCTDFVDGLYAFIDEIQISFCKVTLPMKGAN
ncbi:uncharacterized protein LOC110457124 [Mizuhopecten yessoensis]|uniref:D-galactoside-specific lectin n=1 Tax=Mizuhopecten yessoensis TaxID=6573 RepID=A0A210Q9I7_MIZYE|nr:uncharacterized protein LOC110457124 [Mizuhopecten yessoensis]OWF45391.1 D-galactoside-specific lectin [Mizuhopecten yessoensis]